MDPVRLYLKDIRDIPLLTQEEERVIGTKARKGDEQARKKLIQSNLRLVINIAKKYSSYNIPILDLIEEGNLGLIKAVSKFNPNKGYKFSTYASWWIKQYVTRAITNQSHTIRIPVYIAEMIARWKRASEELSEKQGRDPTLKEVARKLKIPIAKVKELNNVVLRVSSLDAPLGEDESGQVMDLIEKEDEIGVTEHVDRILKKDRIMSLMEKITPREKEVLYMRFGLKDGVSHTLEEMAKKMGITRERVRQIENVATRKLRAFIVAQKAMYE
jgi:RNA polymerase primary sigma factor